MIAKKGSGVQSVTYDEAVDEALCFGWIDGQKAKYDRPRTSCSASHVAPDAARGRGSTPSASPGWSRRRRCTPPGFGRSRPRRPMAAWEAAYAGPATAAVPDDLQAALDASPAAVGASVADLELGQ